MDEPLRSLHMDLVRLEDPEGKLSRTGHIVKRGRFSGSRIHGVSDVLTCFTLLFCLSEVSARSRLGQTDNFTVLLGGMIPVPV